MPTTWAQAIQTPTVQIRWLLVLSTQSGSVVGRFADAELYIGNLAYAGALQVLSAPSLVVDPYGPSVQRPSARIALKPVPYGHPAMPGVLRPYDLDEAYQRRFSGLRGALYRWAEGSDLEELDLRVWGYVEPPSLSEDGTLTFDLLGRSGRFNRKLPRYTIDADTFPNLHDEDGAGGLAMLAGSFVRVPCPVYDTVNHRAMIAEGSVSPTAAYRGDVAISGESFAEDTDARGVPFTYCQLEAAAVDDQITVSGQGWKDDDQGTYTGAPNSNLAHPADILHYYAITRCGWGESRVNPSSFKALRGELEGWVSSVHVLADEETTFGDLCIDVGRIMRAAIFEENGKLTARRLRFQRPPVLKLVEGEGLRKLQSIEWDAQPDRPTKLTARYAWGWSKKKQAMDYLASVTLDSTNYAPFAANLLANEGEEVELPTIETRAFRNRETMHRAMIDLAELHGVTRKRVTALADRRAHGLRIYDTVLLTARSYPSADGLGCANKLFAVTGIPRADLDENELTLLECKP